MTRSLLELLLPLFFVLTDQEATISDYKKASDLFCASRGYVEASGDSYRPPFEWHIAHK